MRLFTSSIGAGRPDQVIDLAGAGVIIDPVTVEQARLAREAFHDFGKGRHPTGLNFGGCFAYALAKVTGGPLLFKGEDFKKADIVSAL